MRSTAINGLKEIIVSNEEYILKKITGIISWEYVYSPAPR